MRHRRRRGNVAVHKYFSETGGPDCTGLRQQYNLPVQGLVSSSSLDILAFGDAARPSRLCILPRQLLVAARVPNACSAF